MGQFEFEDVMGVADRFRREPNPNTDSLTPYLLNEAGEDRGICPDFLTEAISRFAEDDTVKPMLTKAVAGLSLQLSNMTMNDNYKPYINVSSGKFEAIVGDPR
jgi:ubiquitin conjugation factor E4 B